MNLTGGMDGKSRWADNIMVERWFRSLKVEELYVNEYASPRMLRKAIAAYIQQYNTVRPHEELRALRVELNRIGILINQIARKANAGLANRAEIQDAFRLLAEAHQLLEKATAPWQ